MASSSPVPAEDQTDEDFFDRLVEDEFGLTESHEGLSNIADERTKLEDSGNTCLPTVAELEHMTMQAHPSLKGETEGATLAESSDIFTVACETEPIVFEEKSSDAEHSHLSFETESRGPTGIESEFKLSDSSEVSGAKSAGVKEVDWSAFSVASQQYNSEGLEPFSDFFLENSDVSTNQVNMNADLNSSFTSVHGNGTDLVSSEQQDNGFYGNDNGCSTYGNDSNYWENIYPGWKFDADTGNWCQVDANDATMNSQPVSYLASDTNAQESFRDDDLGGLSGVASCKNLEVSYSQHTSSLMIGAVAEDCKTSTVSSVDQYSLGVNGYPPNMVFDPQYPGWYFDTNTQQWSTLDAYNQSIQQTFNSVQNQVKRDMNACNGFIGEGSLSFYDDVGSLDQTAMQGQGYQHMAHSMDALTNNFAQHSIHQSDAIANRNQQTLNLNDSNMQEMNYSSPQVGNSWDAFQSSGYNNNKGSNGFQNFVPAESMHQFNQPNSVQRLQSSFTSYADEKSTSYHDQQFHNTSYPYISYSGNGGRSSAGRPPHPLVTFGFGGKLIVMKVSNSAMKVGYNNKESSEAAFSILNLMEVIKDQDDSIGGYFHSLSQRSFPGPLVGGNSATKDVYRWIDESITHCESPLVDPKKGKAVKLLLSLLKVSCQHYGKLRSPFGSGISLEENDGPESAVTKLFASAQTNGHTFTHCMQSFPSDAHVQATSIEMQNLLVSGKRKEALQCAQEGQLWGPALVLAAQLGEKFYVDTVKQMAQRLFVCGSPLRTLCLLIAGQPADVFSTQSSTSSSFSGTANGYGPFQSNCMLDDWEENLAIITANRTKDDELVVIHLGDCLWKERGEVTAAHTCYLVAEANFEPYSDSARLCLIGADHWKYPRTYASPDAIQRTELYEYAKVIGNSQFALLPFQPYKLLYANMLAEIGKTSESLRYCQASMKLLRNSSRTPEVEMWKSLISSLEERLCGHQQGGFSENLAPAKLVGKIFTSLDRSIHRIMGAPSSLPPMPQISANGRESQLITPKVVNSQSTMTMSSLIPSASLEAMSDWTSDAGRKSLHSRSISEPDFGRTPKQGSSNDANAGDAHNKTLPSRFGRIGSQFFQKTMGWVSRTRSDRQARLGESNKFYYDEKLKRWVEEGAEPPAEELSLPEPPKVASFQNGPAEYNINNALKNQNLAVDQGSETKSPIPSENSRIPPISPSPNQFSARRMGVRSRYVDTFNKGSDSPANPFQSPSIPAVKPASGARFFVPASPSMSNETATSFGTELSFDSPPLPPPASSTIERFPSMNNIDLHSYKDTTAPLQNGDDSIPHSRAASRGSSWDSSNADFGKANPSVAGVGAPPLFFPTNSGMLHSGSPLQQVNAGGGALGEDLDEVELS